MVPLWILGYLLRYAKVRMLLAALIALIMVGIILGVYDYLIGMAWNEPLLLQLVRPATEGVS